MGRFAIMVALLCTAIATAHAASPVPPACRDAGYMQMTFDSDFSRTDQAFDRDAAYLPGYQWYRWNWFDVRADKTLAGWNENGSITARGGFDGHLVSAAKSPKFPGYVGTAFGGGLCVEVILRFDPHRGISGEGHPSFWAMSKEHLAANGDDQWPGKEPNFSHFAEWDILEYYKIQPPGFLSSWVEWFGPYIRDIEQQVAGRMCRRPYCKKAWSFAVSPGAVPAELDWNQWQTVVGLWVPATADQPGRIQTFLNDTAIAPPYQWLSTNIERNDIDKPMDFSIIDKHHMVLVISSGAKPIFVRSVRVFQKDSRQNLSR